MPEAPAQDFWVFAYGSLMWRPGFAYLRSVPAVLRGYHRAFCIYSHHYRGTRERPGIVLGLDRGGACRGRAFRVAAAEGESVIRYLHEREMVTAVYVARWLPVEIEGRRQPALAYVADRRHPSYAGKLDACDLVRLIRQGRGQSGSCRHYLEETVRHLDELGIRESELHRLLQLVGQAEAEAAAVAVPATGSAG
ncbi:MAG: gamma-glutamylcyclotransferase [Rhodospirillaceae bacterium]|nr:gamma-glutamylcyclotransferase [Rhodospirillaceae bacterium]